MSDFELLLDEDNELRFNVAVEGSGSGSVKSRFLINKADGFDLCFEGQASADRYVRDSEDTGTSVLALDCSPIYSETRVLQDQQVTYSLVLIQLLDEFSHHLTAPLHPKIIRQRNFFCNGTPGLRSR